MIVLFLLLAIRIKVTTSTLFCTPKSQHIHTIFHLFQFSLNDSTVEASLLSPVRSNPRNTSIILSKIPSRNRDCFSSRSMSQDSNRTNPNRIHSINQTRPNCAFTSLVGRVDPLQIGTPGVFFHDLKRKPINNY